MLSKIKKNKQVILLIIVLFLVLLSMFFFVRYGIALRELEKQEIAEQISKFGYYRKDFYVNADRELLVHKYNNLMSLPMFILLMVIIPMVFVTIFQYFEGRKNQ